MDMLINKSLFSFIEKKKCRGSKEFYLAFPVVAYKIEVIGTVKTGNPISNAVSRLCRYYHSTEFALSEDYLELSKKSIPARIADDLALTEDFVRCIIEQEKLKKELPADTDNDLSTQEIP